MLTGLFKNKKDTHVILDDGDDDGLAVNKKIGKGKGKDQQIVKEKGT